MPSSSCSSELMKCSYFNARSIKNKLPDLHDFIYDVAAPDVVFITETWLNESVCDTMIDPLSNYTVLGCDRDDRCGRGVVVLINRALSVVKFDLVCVNS